MTFPFSIHQSVLSVDARLLFIGWLKRNSFQTWGWSCASSSAIWGEEWGCNFEVPTAVGKIHFTEIVEFKTIVEFCLIFFLSIFFVINFFRYKLRLCGKFLSTTILLLPQLQFSQITAPIIRIIDVANWDKNFFYDKLWFFIVNNKLNYSEDE